MNLRSALLLVASTFSFSNYALAALDYAGLAGEYTFQSGSGKNAEDCKGAIRVEADPAKSQVLLFQMQPTHGNGFLSGFFEINKGPKNECCAPADLFYHHDMLTTGEQLSIESTVHDYYKTLRVKDVDLFRSSLVLSADILSLSEKMQDYERPQRSFARQCVFVKN